MSENCEEVCSETVKKVYSKTQQKLLDKRSELIKEIAEIEESLGYDMDTDMYLLLSVQLNVMKSYSSILLARVGLLN